ncbi:MAG: 30S ribosomal protein S13 [SAR202 cluster bacterium]|nr:30S ribosomal protein S13 [SAR202 cluster bacterium]|tara:strand:+ start:217 stop:594 length:378 start_codon:yes stop_codon:yes gene_type:complete
MALISGVNIPDNKRAEVSLTSIFGIGPTKSKEIMSDAGIDGNPRIKDLTEEQLAKIREVIDKNVVVEGDLRQEVNLNIRRLIDIGTYRGNRHRRNLPVRGQRTKTNSRTKRGKRQAVAGKKIERK